MKTEKTFACGLIARAARRSPASLAARLEEEWLADLAQRRGALARARFALGCLWAAHVIARADWIRSAAGGSAVVGHRTLAAYLPRNADRFARRVVIIFFIVAIHAALIYALCTGLAVRIAAALPQPMSVTFSNVVRPRAQPLPPPKPDLLAPRVFVDKPTLEVTVPPDPSATRSLAPIDPIAPIASPRTSSSQHPGSTGARRPRSGLSGLGRLLPGFREALWRLRRHGRFRVRGPKRKAHEHARSRSILGSTRTR